MEAIVFADRVGNELMPLTRNIPVPLLPVNGKALIEHTFEDLAAADVKSILLVVAEEQDERMRAQLGAGGAWGLDVDYVSARSGESPSQLARRVADRLPESFLAMRGDVYRSGSIRSFRDAANNVLAKQVVAQINGQSAQLCMCRQRDLHLDVLTWDPSRRNAMENWRTIRVDGADFSHLYDTTEFYLANLDGLDSRVAELNAGRDSSDARFFAGSNTELPTRVVRDGPVLVGNNCTIGNDVQLIGPVVIGNDVRIDDGAFLHACVVLPGTHVPADTELRNAVVTSEIALGIAGNVICRFADRLDGAQG